MSAAKAPRRGIVVFGATLETMAEAADRAGFDAIWTSELYNRSATVTLAAIAPRTSRARIGSGILYGTYALARAAEDADLARREAAAMIAFYATVKSYAPMFGTRGFAAEAATVRAAFADRDLKTMIAAVTDPMIDEFASAGTPAEVAAALRRYDGIGRGDPLRPQLPGL